MSTAAFVCRLPHVLTDQLDSARATYGIKTTKLAKLFAKMYFKDEKSESYQRLIHHTEPAKNPSPVSGISFRVEPTLTISVVAPRFLPHYFVQIAH